MGNIIDLIFNRLLYYPLQSTRSCIFEPEDQLVTQSDGAKSEYDKVVEEFEKKLAEKKIENNSIIDGKSWIERKVLVNYPEWNESTLKYLHSLYLTFCKEDNKMMDFKGFSSLLICLFCEIDTDKQNEKFKETDSNQDGFIDYNEFLEVIYHFGKLKILAKAVYEKTHFINTLTIGQQLEYGLF